MNERKKNGRPKPQDYQVANRVLVKWWFKTRHNIEMEPGRGNSTPVLQLVDEPSVVVLLTNIPRPLDLLPSQKP